MFYYMVIIHVVEELSTRGFLKPEPSFNMSVVIGIVIAFISTGIAKLLPPIRLTDKKNST